MVTVVLAAPLTTKLGDFCATQALDAYGLPDLDHSHMVSCKSLKGVVRAAKKAAKKKQEGRPAQKFLADGEITKWAPQWMSQKGKMKKDDLSHAQWIACWWSRALAQMTAQAASQSETVTFQALLSSFLIANRIAVEETCRVGWHYDEDLWEF